MEIRCILTKKKKKNTYSLHLPCLTSFIILLSTLNPSQIYERFYFWRTIDDSTTRQSNGRGWSHLKTNFAILLQIMRVGKHPNTFSQESTIPDAQTNSAEYVYTPSLVSKSKVFSLNDIQPKRLSPTPSFSVNNEASPPIHSQ
jgi:hypothetical protein